MSDDFQQFINNIGHRVDRAWETQHREHSCFSGIAAEGLQAFSPCEYFDVGALLKWASSRAALPLNLDRAHIFGDTPVTIFDGRDFYIEALLWSNGTTSIHDHGFTGAWTLLSGSSLHTRWSFDRQLEVSQALLIGNLAPTGHELLGPADVREIRSGNKSIHSLFHISNPSVSIVVRTAGRGRGGIQYEYRPNRIAFHSEGAQRYRPHLWRVLDACRADEELYLDVAAEPLGNGNPLIALVVLEHALSHSLSEHARAEVMRLAGNQHAEHLGAIVSSLRNMVSRSKIASRRGIFTSEEHRFLSAILLNVTGRNEVFSLLHKNEGESHPADRLLAGLSEMAGIGDIGIDLTQTNQGLIASLLASDSAATFAQAVEHRFSGSTTPPMEQIIEHCQSMAENPYLRSVIADHPALGCPSFSLATGV